MLVERVEVERGASCLYHWHTPPNSLGKGSSRGKGVRSGNQGKRETSELVRYEWGKRGVASKQSRSKQVRA